MSGRYALFALTTTLSAVLLFSVQPLIAKALLPHFGGAPAVWATCLVFFQALLLAGYFLTDRLSRVCSPARHALVQLGVLLVAGAALPMTIPGDVGVTGNQSPLGVLLLVLLRTVGAPFLALSMMAPAIQRWYAADEDTSVTAPSRVYRLYALSNAGSLLALLVYPLVIEPECSLTVQHWGWSTLYGGLVASVGFYSLLVARSPATTATASTTPIVKTKWHEAGLWLGLSFLPSTLLASSTTYLTVEILPFPLLWVLPLAIYLATFIVAFAMNSTEMQRWWCDRVAAVGLLACAWAVATRVEMSLVAQVLLHLVTLAVAGLACHLHLAASKPETARLTVFYVWISVGGMLGGMFNALIAPACFNFIAEYPISLIAATVIIGSAATFRPRDHGIGLIVGIGLGLLSLIVGNVLVGATSPVWRWAWAFLGVLPLLWWSRPLALPVALSIITVGCTLSMDRRENLVMQTRSFFGVHRVIAGAAGKTHSLQHGSTTHGLQFRDVDLRIRRIPLTYYFPTGPIGQVFVGRQEAKPYRVGMVGLGIGTLAAYGRPGDRFDFFEIDPAVAEIARDSGHFTQLRDSPAECRITLGDARQSLATQLDGTYDILVLDAFTGDSVPAHPLTQEAFRIYAAKLKPDGLLALHISSRYLNLAPVVVGGLQPLGWDVRVQFDSPITDDEFRRGKRASLWAATSPQWSRWPQVAQQPRWEEAASITLQPWTDERSSLWPIIRFE